jgi:hypothetical protein
MATKPNKPGPDGQVRSVDILALEMDQNLPHWLHPIHSDTPAKRAIREKHRAKYLKQQKRKSKRS